jgi:hypothetical protein
LMQSHAWGTAFPKLPSISSNRRPDQMHRGWCKSRNFPTTTTTEPGIMLLAPGMVLVFCGDAPSSQTGCTAIPLAYHLGKHSTRRAQHTSAARPAPKDARNDFVAAYSTEKGLGAAAAALLVYTRQPRSLALTCNTTLGGNTGRLWLHIGTQRLPTPVFLSSWEGGEGGAVRLPVHTRNSMPCAHVKKLTEDLGRGSGLLLCRPLCRGHMRIVAPKTINARQQHQNP